jgi:hypothetical protein
MAALNSETSLDDVLGALSNAKRRELIWSLSADSSLTDDGRPGIAVDDVDMYHVHLPKLADYKIINWNRSTSIVTKGPNFETAEEVLECLEETNKLLAPTEIDV